MPIHSGGMDSKPSRAKRRISSILPWIHRPLQALGLLCFVSFFDVVFAIVMVMENKKPTARFCLAVGL